MKRVWHIFWILFICSAFHAQVKDANWLLLKNINYKTLLAEDKALLDSILPIYHSSTNDSVKLTALTYLSEELQKEELWVGYSKAIINYKPVRNTLCITKLRANANNNIAIFNFDSGNINEAIKYYTESIRLDSSILNYEGLTNSLYNLGYVYEKQGNIKANEYFAICLKIAEKIGDKLAIARCKSSQAGFYFDMGEDAYAMKLSMEALEIRKKENDLVGLAASYNNIGNYYHDRHNYDRAYYFYIKSLEVRKKTNDLQGMVTNLGNIGSIYLSRKEYDKAKTYYDEMFALSKKLNNDLLMAYSHDNFSSLYQHINDFDKAKYHALQTLEIGKRLGSTELQYRASDFLHRIYREKRDPVNALLMLELKISLKEKMVGQEQQKAIYKQQYKTEYEKKEADVKEKARIEAQLIKAANLEEKRRQNIITTSISIGFILVLILAIVIFRSLQLNRNKNKIITEQKKLVEEKQKEVMDSIKYARRIQQSLMPTEKYIERNLKR